MSPLELEDMDIIMMRANRALHNHGPNDKDVTGMFEYWLMLETQKYVHEKIANPKPYDPTPAKLPTCPKCGLQLSPVMMYACPNYPCPTGLGGRSTL